MVMLEGLQLFHNVANYQCFAIEKTPCTFNFRQAIKSWLSVLQWKLYFGTLSLRRHPLQGEQTVLAPGVQKLNNLFTRL